MGARARQESGRYSTTSFVKLLLDEMLTNRLAPLLVGHEVCHAVDLGWRHIGNGKLLALAEEHGFQALITKDCNIPYQQTFAGRKIALIVVTPEDQTLPALLALAPSILRALPSLKPGSVVKVAQS